MIESKQWKCGSRNEIFQSIRKDVSIIKIRLIIGSILVLLSIKPLFQIGMELYYRSEGREDMIDQVYVNFMELGKVEILGKDKPIDVDEIKVKNYLFLEGETLEIDSLEEYELLTEEASTSLRYARDYLWAGNTIRMEDQFDSGHYTEDSREHVPLKISINGQDWSVDKEVEVRPSAVDNNRYHGYFDVALDAQTNELVLVQRISGVSFSNEEELAWRLLSVGENGKVQEDSFSYNERGELPTRVDYINQTATSPFSLGYKSNILQGWPTVFFPLLYPIVSGFIGFLLIGSGVLVFLPRRGYKRS